MNEKPITELIKGLRHSVDLELQVDGDYLEFSIAMVNRLITHIEDLTAALHSARARFSDMATVDAENESKLIDNLWLSAMEGYEAIDKLLRPDAYKTPPAAHSHEEQSA